MPIKPDEKCTVQNFAAGLKAILFIVFNGSELNEPQVRCVCVGLVLFISNFCGSFQIS